MLLYGKFIGTQIMQLISKLVHITLVHASQNIIQNWGIFYIFSLMGKSCTVHKFISKIGWTFDPIVRPVGPMIETDLCMLLRVHHRIYPFTYLQILEILVL